MQCWKKNFEIVGIVLKNLTFFFFENLHIRTKSPSSLHLSKFSSLSSTSFFNEKLPGALKKISKIKMLIYVHDPALGIFLSNIWCEHF